MSAKIIDGKTIAQQVRNEVAAVVQQRLQQVSVPRSGGCLGR